MSYVTCQSCGRPNADIARICRYCGTELQRPAARQQRTTYAEPPPPQPGSYVPPHSWKSGSLPQAPQPYAQPHAQAPALAADNFRCPYCHSTAPPVVSQRISTAGWIVFFALLVFCLPLCFIGLFIKEEYRMCSWCRGALS